LVSRRCNPTFSASPLRSIIANTVSPLARDHCQQPGDRIRDRPRTQFGDHIPAVGPYRLILNLAGLGTFFRCHRSSMRRLRNALLLATALSVLCRLTRSQRRFRNTASPVEPA
jgi:hypothetical protein